jgi:aerobic-type carbon monoxide dehydrogenase small subunit (CoxS/CutS family)
MAFKIKVNGVDRTADVDGDTPLLWVLRDVFGMTGTVRLRDGSLRCLHGSFGRGPDPLLYHDHR